MAVVAALGAAVGTAHASPAADARPYTCTKSAYSSDGKHYGKVLCTGGSSAVMRHKAMVNCRASDGRTWVAEGPFRYRDHTSTATCGTAKVTFVTWISRPRG
ncbi:hypothetical protein [Streptomyces sp. NPDC057623]|uniref:hypothetical protein n=1 Tax=Streptomyces sp. NPDC057623 TaxID=3346187 RepID=UPI0036A85265